jgi:hypothetical protein
MKDRPDWIYESLEIGMDSFADYFYGQNIEKIVDMVIQAEDGMTAIEYYNTVYNVPERFHRIDIIDYSSWMLDVASEIMTECVSL